MVTLDRAVASLRVVGDELQPDEVTGLLGARPSKSFARGDVIVGGRSHSRVAKFGLWLLEAGETQPADLDAQVRELLRPLTTDLAAWRDVADRFELEVFCGWFMKRINEGVFITTETLGALAERNIALDLDLYAGDDDD